MPRSYDSSPLIEALCEIAFEPEIGWDLTIPGLLYDNVKSEYPEKEEQQFVGIEMDASKGVPSAQRPTKPMPKMIFKTKDRSGLLQVSPLSFAVNQLPPYIGWVKFREVIARNVEVHHRVAPTRRVKGIMLRYINRVKMEQTTFSLEEYFNILPQVPSANPENPIESYFMSTRLGSAAPKGSLTIVSTAENPKIGSSFLFDFQFASRGNDCPDRESVLQWLDDAHIKISLAFEGAFTEKTHKELFKEKTL